MKPLVSMTAAVVIAGLSGTTYAGVQPAVAPQAELRESGSATLVALYDSRSSETKETILSIRAAVRGAPTHDRMKPCRG